MYTVERVNFSASSAGNVRAFPAQREKIEREIEKEEDEEKSWNGRRRLTCFVECWIYCDEVSTVLLRGIFLYGDYAMYWEMWRKKALVNASLWSFVVQEKLGKLDFFYFFCC